MSPADLVLILVALAGCAVGCAMPSGKTQRNSLGMDLVRVEPGSFMMGNDAPLPTALAGAAHLRRGDPDERPAHRVRITQPFYLGACQVTNAQYEQFDPEHRKLRGKVGFSNDDDEAVVFVSWHDAARFCEWLSEQEGLPYRLPTEAEWEYACRAGTPGPFHTGDTLPEVHHRNQVESWFPAERRGQAWPPQPLHVGRTPPNAWGLHDMHGNVEEWCGDWYGPYPEGDQADPVGCGDGLFKVTRGGSHSTLLYYLRSANRSGALPQETSWLIGFRVVLGEMPSSKPLPPPPVHLCQRDVKQERPPDITHGPDPDTPYFKGPRIFVKIPPPGEEGPLFYRHNHVPSIVECPNGDLLAAWYSCVREPGREVALVASRLRYGQEEWEPASLFWDAPDRTEESTALWFDGERTIFNFIGLSAAATWGNLVVVMRTSTDNGATWSRERVIVPEHGLRRMPIPCVIRTREGHIILPCDAVTGGQGGTALYLSEDNGETWHDPGGTAAGIHGGVVQLADGRLMTLGRGDDIAGRMPMSLSDDMGRTWTYRASPFPPIGGGQRLALLRLREGPIFFASFAPELMLPDGAGGEVKCTGLFCALSYDEGETWPVMRMVTDDAPAHEAESMDARGFIMTPTVGEPGGYLAVCQGANGLIHLISSRQHYVFNLAWVERRRSAG